MDATWDGETIELKENVSRLHEIDKRTLKKLILRLLLGLTFI